MGINILIISPCSGTKQLDPVIGHEDIDTVPRRDLLKKYPDSVASAAEMYVGREHKHVQLAIEKFQQLANVDWYIVSAGFGVLESDTRIPSYECTFSDPKQVRQRARNLELDIGEMTNDELVTAVGREKNIPQDLRQILAEAYDMVFVALGTQYLIAVREALTEVPEHTMAFAYTAEGSKEFIGDCYWIPATEEERNRLGTTWLELRGKELLTLAENIEDTQYLERIQMNPEKVRELSTSV